MLIQQLQRDDMLNGLQHKYFDCGRCNKHFPWRLYETAFYAYTDILSNRRRWNKTESLCEPCYYEMLRSEINSADNWDAVINAMWDYRISVDLKIVKKDEHLCRVQLSLGRKKVTGQTNIMFPLREIKLNILDLVHELEVAKPHRRIGLKSFLSFLRG